VTVDFDRDIKPLFDASCLRCHGAERPKSKFSLMTRESALKGGDNGVAIIPGESAKSPLVHMVAGLVEDMEMPPKGKAPALTADQIGLLRAWIDQGAKWGTTNAQPQLTFTVEPMLQYVTVSGNRDKFREHNWMTDGWDGGFSELQWSQKVAEDTKFSFDGQARFNSPDYRFKFTLEKEDVGFVRGGYEQFRRYYDNGGGYADGIIPPHYQLDNGLHLDNGRAWIDLGLTLPDWPRLVFGYEYQFRDGIKSSLTWGPVSGGGPSRGVYPAFKDVDEKVHIVKFDLTHEIQGWLIEDNFRGEFYDLNNRRQVTDAFTAGNTAPDSITDNRDSYRHFQGVNTIRLEKPVKDWWLLSGGYYFSQLDGDAGFSQESFIPTDPTLPSFLGDTSSDIVISRRSHIFNANTMLGPWEWLTFSAGVQSEWTRQHGFGTSLLVLGPATMSGDLDRQVVEENFGLRYTSIPHTVLFADTRFQQERVGQQGQQFLDDSFDDDSDFMRDSQGRNDLKDYRAGFTISPWTRVALESSYRHRLKQNDYNHLLDTDGSGTPGFGYPAFITARDIESGEVEAKLVLRVMPWWKTTLKYQITATDYRTTTDAGLDPDTGDPGPAGGVLAGNYDAHTYSINTTLTPWRRLVWSGTFSYSDSRIISALNNDAVVAPYRGGVYTVLANTTYVLSQKMDLHATYSYSRADYGQRLTDGLPLGIEYERHGVVAGLTHRFTKNWVTRLQYGFYQYREPTAGGFNDYTAHAIFATLAFTL
jgi:hypothetical protein